MEIFGEILTYWQSNSLLVIIGDFLKIYGVLTILFNLLVYLIDIGWLSWLPFGKKYIRIFRDILLFKSIHSRDSYPSMIPSGKDGEKNFYKIFAVNLKKAKSAIFLAGDGFNMAAKVGGSKELSSPEKADKLDGAIIAAMDRDTELIYKRFQITSSCNINWISRLVFMKKKFGDRFRVFTNRDFEHIGSYCVIDPMDDSCVYEWQLVGGRNSSAVTNSKCYAFVYNNKALCNVGVEMFRDIENAEHTNFLKLDNSTGDKETGMSVERLQKLQQELWIERVLYVKENPRYGALDKEIKNAFKIRGVDINNFDPETEMEFRQEDFPVIAHPFVRN